MSEEALSAADKASGEPVQDLIVLGRKLGTYQGWDQFSEHQFVFLNFQPIGALVAQLDSSDLIVDYESGEAFNADENGVPTKTIDLVLALHALPKHTLPVIEEPSE